LDNNRGAIHLSLNTHLHVVNTSTRNSDTAYNQDPNIIYAQHVEETTHQQPLPLPNATRLSQLNPDFSKQARLERVHIDNEMENFVIGARKIRPRYRSASEKLLQRMQDGLDKVQGLYLISLEHGNEVYAALFGRWRGITKYGDAGIREELAICAETASKSK
jgi:hypothetical protein